MNRVAELLDTTLTLIAGLLFGTLFLVTVLNIVLRNLGGIAWLWIPGMTKLLFSKEIEIERLYVRLERELAGVVTMIWDDSNGGEEVADSETIERESSRRLGGRIVPATDLTIIPFVSSRRDCDSPSWLISIWMISTSPNNS